MLKHGQFCTHTCVDLIAFLWTHGGNTGLSSVLLLAFSPDRTEGGGVAQGGEGGLNCREQVKKVNQNFTVIHFLTGITNYELTKLNTTKTE